MQIKATEKQFLNDVNFVGGWQAGESPVRENL